MSPERLQPGDLVGDDLVVEAAVGAGGTAIVYRARRAGCGERVALKVLFGDPAGWARAERERALLATVDHPGVARILASGETAGGARFVVLPWLDGQSLADRLAEPGLSARTAVAVITAAAAALGAAHRVGVIHRDVKPGHVWCRDDGGVAVIDFGIARGRGDDRVTRTGTTIGTPGYMAPEQITGAAVDARADVFALGCVLYEALTGAPAFAGNHPAILRGKVLWTEPRPLTERCPEAGPDLAALVASMLAKDVRHRPLDGDAVAAALAAVPAPAAGPRRRSGHHETPTRPLGAVRLVAVGLALDDHTAPATAPAITLEDHSAIALAEDDGTDLAAAALALAATLGSGRTIAVARTRDVEQGLSWCTRAAATAAALTGAATAPIVCDLTRTRA